MYSPEPVFFAMDTMAGAGMVGPEGGMPQPLPNALQEVERVRSFFPET